jgi:hypothetical protein
MHSDLAQKKFFASFSASTLVAAACLFSLSTSLRAASVPESTPTSIKDYQANMPVIQKMLTMACSNQKIDSARATIANATYEKSNAILAELQGDIQQNTQFLAHPSTAVENEYKTKAQDKEVSMRDQLRSAQDQYEYNQRQYQLGNLSRDSLDKTKQNLVSAQSQAATANQMPSSDVMSETVQARTSASLTSLKQLESAAQDVAQASSQAQGCYLTATGTGSLANPAMDDALVSTKATSAPSNTASQAAAASPGAQASGASSSTSAH